MKLIILDEQGKDVTHEIRDLFDMKVSFTDQFLQTIKKKKLTVEPDVLSRHERMDGGIVVAYYFPVGAENIKCTYEITENL